MIVQRAVCEFCRGRLEKHDDDRQHPWKHQDPQDAMECAIKRPVVDAVPIAQTIVNTV